MKPQDQHKDSADGGVDNSNLFQARGNLLYLEDVVHDPIERLVSLFDKSESSEEIKCLLLSILSSGKIDGLKNALIGSDTSSETEDSTDADKSPSQSSNQRRSDKKNTNTSNEVTRSRPGLQRCYSERRVSSGLKPLGKLSRHQSHDHAPRSRPAPPQRTKSATAKQSDGNSIGRGSISNRRRSPKPDLDTSQRSTRRSSSNPRRPKRSGSADVVRAPPQRSGSFGAGRRRARSNERDVLSQSHHCTARRSFKRKEALSMSLHGPATHGVTTDALQRNLMSRLERSESKSDMKFDASLLDDDANLRVRGKGPNCCSASHDGVINPNAASIGDALIPTSIDISSDADVSNSFDDSMEMYAQFHPEGVREVSISSKLKQTAGLDQSKNAAESKKAKGIGGFLHRITGKGKSTGKKSDEKMKVGTTSTYDVYDSDIESDSDNCSVSSFASDTSL